MDMLKAAGLAVCAALCALLLRRLRPEMSTAVSLGAGALLLCLCLPVLMEVVSGITALAQQGGVEDEYLSRLLKVAGVSLLSDLAAQTCRDAGEDGLGAKVELAGRVMLLSLALPAMRTLLSSVLSLSP